MNKSLIILFCFAIQGCFVDIDRRPTRPSPDILCHHNWHCPPSSYCGGDGYCYEDVPYVECYTHQDCAIGAYCGPNGLCYQEHYYYDECLSHIQCPSGYYCAANGVCYLEPR